VVAQRVKIVGVLVATGDGHHTGGDHVGIRVRDEQRVARVRERLGNHLSDAEAAGRLAQHDRAAVGRQVAGVARGCELLAFER